MARFPTKTRRYFQEKTQTFYPIPRDVLEKERIMLKTYPKFFIPSLQVFIRKYVILLPHYTLYNIETRRFIDYE